MTLSLLLLLVVSATPEQPSVGVMDFAAQGAAPELASAFSSLAAHELERLAVFRVVSSEMVRALLGAERQKQLLGAGEAGGPNIAELTNFDYLVTGKVQKVGKDFLLVLALLETKTSKQRSSQTAKAPSEAKLMGELAPAMVKLLGKLLSERSGSVVVTSSETGAEVKVDDTTVGVTPLPGRVPAGAGPHLVQVEKNGFVTWRKEVRVEPDATVEHAVTLVPSPDTIAAYEGSAFRMRLGAWLTTGLAAAAGASFFVCQSFADRAYEDFRIKRETLVVMGEGTASVNRTNAEAAGQQVQLYQLLSYVSAAVFGAAAVAGAVFWIVGEPPGKYVKYREVAPAAPAAPPAPKAALVPGPGGLAIAGEF